MAKVKRRAISRETRLIVYNKYGGRCAYCGQKIDYKDLQVDHFAPVHLFGDNTSIDNLMPACRPCNIKKGTLTITKFREEIEKSVELLKKESSTFRLAERFGKVSIVYKPVIFYYENF